MTTTSKYLFASAITLLIAMPLMQVRPQTPGRHEARVAGARAANAAEKMHLSEQYGRLPLSFEVNAGQTDASVQFLSRGRGYTLFLTPAEAVMDLRKPTAGTRRAERPAPASPPPDRKAPDSSALPALMRMRLVGADPASKAAGRDPLPGKSNYFFGSDASKWRTGVPTYAKVQYREVYAGIDLIYYGNGRQLEHDFVVKPGARPEQIRLDFPGASKLSLNTAGDLLIAAGGETVTMNAPAVYQQIGGVKRSVSGRYAIQGDQQVAFDVGAYDARETLVIDPVLIYSTYLGGAGDDFGTDIAVDASGFAYVVGQTASTNFPVTTLRVQATNAGGPYDIFVTKLSQDGNSLVYSTYLGGNGTDEGIGIAVDGSGNAYITGDTDSTNYPTTAGALQRTAGGGGDAFVTKLNATGSALVYSTLLGGDSFDIGYSMAVNSAGEAFVAGQTFSGNFPTANSQQAYGGLSDAFVTRLNAAGSALVYSTYWGGVNGDDQGRGIAIDAAGNAYVAGETTATNFPTTAGAFQRTYGGGGYDAVVFKLGPSGNIVYSTLVGGNDTDQARGVAIDSAGDAYITGQTFSTNFPTINAVQPVKAGNPNDPVMLNRADAFMTKLNPTGSGLIFSTYLGGSLEDQGDHGIATDTAGNLYVSGFTHSVDFPLAGSPFQSTYGGGGYDCFVVKISPAGALLYSTYLGGIFSDFGRALAVDGAGNAYVIGFTNSTNLPVTAAAMQPILASTPGAGTVLRVPGMAFSGTIAGGFDAFVSKIGSSSGPIASVSPTSLTFGTQALNTTSAGQTVTLTNTGTAALAITAVAATGDFAQTNTCGTSVAAAANCTITVTFQPTVSGTRTGAVTITDNASGSPQSVTLTGTGAGGSAPAVSLAPATLTFASQPINTPSAAQTVTLNNTGTAPLTITTIATTGDYSQTNTCGTTVAAAASCTISVKFTPTAIGTRTGSLNVTDNAAGSPQSVSLTGTGTGTAAVSLAPATLSFAAQQISTTSAAKTVTLTNTGTATLTITAVGTTGDYSQTNTCGTSVAAAANCTISVKFTPTASGTRTGSLSITDNAAGSPQSVTLSGTGSTQAPIVTLSSTNVAFGNQRVNRSSNPRSVTLTNSGNAPLSIASIAASGNYSQNNNCRGSLAVSATCRINITFTPTATGSRPGTVTITDNAAGSPHVISLSGTGTAGGGG